MAGENGSGVQWLIDLVVSAISKKKVEDDTKEAAKKAENAWTDASKHVEKQWTSAYDKIADKAKELLGIVTGLFALEKIYEFGKESVKAFAEEEASWNRLGGTVRGVGVNYDKVRESLEQNATLMATRSTITARDYADILNRLITISGKYNASVNNVQLVLDIASRRGLDYVTTAQVVGRAMQGNTTMVQRLVGALKEGIDPITQLKEKFKDAAFNELSTFEGRTRQALSSWEQFKVTLGETLVEGSGGVSTVGIIVGYIQDLTTYLRENKSTFEEWVNFVAGQVLRLFKDLADGVIETNKQIKEARVWWIGFRQAILDLGPTLMDFHAWILEHTIQPLLEANVWLVKLFGKHDRLAESDLKDLKKQIQDLRNEAMNDRQNNAFDAAIAKAKLLGNQLQKNKELTHEKTPPDPEENAKALAKEIAALKTIGDQHMLLESDKKRILALEKSLSDQYKNGNLTLEQRAKILGQILTLAQIADAHITHPYAETQSGPGRTQFTPLGDFASGKLAGGPIAAGLAAATKIMQENLAHLQAQFSDIAKWFPERQAEAAAQNFLTKHASAIEATQNAVVGLSHAWEDAFSSIFQKAGRLHEASKLQSQAIANYRKGLIDQAGFNEAMKEAAQIKSEAQAAMGFFATLARSSGAALLGGLAEYASGKEKQEIAEAITLYAKAWGDLSYGNAGGAALAFKSAAGHTAGALAWGILAGGSAAGQSSLAGGGSAGVSGGLPSGATDVGGRIADNAASLGPDIHIHVDGVDPKNARHQALIGQANRQYVRRYGARKITVE